MGTEMFRLRSAKGLVSFQATEQLQTAAIKNKNPFTDWIWNLCPKCPRSPCSKLASGCNIYQCFATYPYTADLFKAGKEGIRRDFFAEKTTLI